MRNLVIATATVAAVLSLALIRVAGQSPVAQPSARTLPRTADGKPNLNGFWQALSTANWDLLSHSAQEGVPAGLGVVEGDAIPYQPWAAAKKKENFERRMTSDPVTKCFLPGVPRVTYLPFPFQIAQMPKYVAIAYEWNHVTRPIYMDGSPHPEALEFWMGDSRGHWEGDTLVVDVTLFNDRTWFDMAGNFHSDALHVVERYTLIDPDHINYEATIEDPKVFTRPWKMSLPLYRRVEKNFQLLDYDCVDFFWQKLLPKSR